MKIETIERCLAIAAALAAIVSASIMSMQVIDQSAAKTPSVPTRVIQPCGENG